MSFGWYAQKRCSKCRARKLLAEFTRCDRYADGHESWCKACKRQHRKNRYRYNPTHRDAENYADKVLRQRRYIESRLSAFDATEHEDEVYFAAAEAACWVEVD